MSTITVVQGTARVDNMTQHVTNAITAELKVHNPSNTVVQTTVADHVKSAITVPPWGAGGADSEPTAWKQLVADTDTFIFVLPEYNHSFPGEWKILMDSLFVEYAGKKAYIAAVGGGQFAGARVMEHVLPVLINFKFVVGDSRLHVGFVAKSFDKQGTVVDMELADRIKKFAAAVS